MTFTHGEATLVTIGSMTVAWGVLQPGWHWKADIAPMAGTDWCQFRHIGICISGRFAGVMADGSTFEGKPGTFYDVAPGHDAWVVGDEPAVSFEFQDVEGWGKPPEEAERQLTTLLFTDIVGSTQAAERMGDAAWKRLLASHLDDCPRDAPQWNSPRRARGCLKSTIRVKRSGPSPTTSATCRLPPPP